jgi:peroxiredoxin
MICPALPFSNLREQHPIPREVALTNVNSTKALADALISAEQQHASLQSRLASYRDSSRTLRPDIASAYDQLIERLGVLDRGEVGPQLGERILEFNLPDENGRLVSLTSLLQSGPVVISLNRGHWCPYCKLDLRSIAETHNRIKKLGAHVVSIMPDGAEFTTAYAKANDLPFPILTDVDLGYSLALGLVFWVGDEIKKLYEEAGIVLQHFQGNQSYFLPVAAKFIVGQDGLVKARQVNIEFRERLEPEDLIAELEKLTG